MVSGPCGQVGRVTLCGHEVVSEEGRVRVGVVVGHVDVEDSAGDCEHLAGIKDCR